MELKVEHLRKTYGTMTVLDDVSFALARGQKVGLVGNNGIGKSTLLKIVAGIVETDSGLVAVRRGAVIGYLPQDTSLSTAESVRDYLRRVSGIGALEEHLDQPASLAEFERRSGYSFDHRLEHTLAGFGLRAGLADSAINTLSSGQRSKVFMAGVLLADPDVLLLDEPTNNLDLPALLWLEDFLSRSTAACIVVSHDRLFLDRLVRKIMEIDWRTRKLTVTNGQYSEYLERIAKERRRQLAEYEAQQEEIRRLTESSRARKAEGVQGANYQGRDNDKFLRGFKRDRAAKSGRVAKALERRIEQMERVERPIERDVLRIRLNPSAPGGSRDLSLHNVIAGYGAGGFHIGPIDLDVSYGARLLILGLNGSGKSTLLRTIDGDLAPLKGDVIIGSSAVIGNLMQEHDTLPREERLREFLPRRAGIPLQETYALIAQYGFNAAEMEKRISEFSPGGRARLLLALFSALSVNVLLLDEPTNHLDLEALEALEEAVTHYEGTIVLVSHDRYFLKKFTATDTYVLSEGRLHRQPNFDAYVEQAEREVRRYMNMI